MKQRIKRPLALLLTAVMVLGMLPTAAFATESDGLCEHHTEHTAECGYREAVAGSPCGHEHDETCGYTPGTEEVPCDKDCTDDDGDEIIDHADGCSYQSAVEGTPCTHVHDENCGYVEAVEGHPCMYATTPCPECAAQNGDVEQTPVDNGGLSSGATLLTGEDSYFSTLTLTGFNEATDNTTYSTTTKDLLQVDADAPLKWHLGSTGARYPATMSLNVGSGDVGDGATRTLTIELAKGLEFVSYPEGDDLPTGVALSQEPSEDAVIKSQYGYSSVYGKLVYALSDSADVNGFRLDNIIIQPTRAFFNESENGMKIEDALQVTYTAGYGDESKNVSETKSFDVELWGALKTNGIHPYSNKYSYVLAPGESTQNRLCLWTMENALNGQLIKKITYTIEADEELIFSEPSISATNGEKAVTMTDSTGSDGKKTVVFSSSDLQIGETASISGSSFISYNLNFEYQVSVDANTAPDVYTYVIKSAEVELESGATLAFSDKNDISFTVQERLDDGSDANFTVQDITISRANTNQTDINMTMSGLVWENIGVNATLPKTVEIWFDNNAVINVVSLPQYNGIEEKTVTATLRLVDGTTKVVPKSRDDFADPTQITLAEFGETGAVSIQSLTAQVGRLAASESPLATRAWTVKNNVQPATLVFPAYGHFADVETASTTTTYTIWNTGYEKDAEGANTKTATCTANASQENQVNFATTSSISSFPSSLENGDVLHMDVLFQQYYAGATDSAPLVQPVVYLRQPKGMTFSRTSLRLYDRVNGNDYSATQINPVSITDVTSSCDVDDGSKIWQIVLPEDYILGYYDENMSHHGLRIQYDLTVLPNAASASIDQASMIFLTNLDGISATNGGSDRASDIYSVTGKGTGTMVCGLLPQICTLKGSDQISMGSAIKTDLDDSYFNYVENDTSTIASFAAGQTGSIQLNVVNNGSTAATDAVFYIPLPKPDADYSALFGGEDAGTLNLYLTKQGGEYFASTGTTPSVSYAKVTGYDDESGLPLDTTKWVANYSDDCNMIRVEYRDGIQPGSESTLTFYVKTSDSAGDSGKISVFYPAVDCTYGSVTQRGAQAPIAIQCWNGTVSGTVFDDTDRDGVQDEDEGGLSGITVEVKPENAPSKYATTGGDGTYTVTGVRTDGEVTVTIRDMEHSFNSATGANARQYSTPVETPPGNGSAYSVVVPVEGAPSNATYTYDARSNAAATVSAGLIKPYTVTFNGTGSTSVNPSTIHRFPGETVGTHGQKVSVSTGAGENFKDQWYMSVDQGEATTVENSALLDTEITGDTTFMPVIESEVNAVYFMVWDNDEGKLVPLSYEVEYNKTLGSVISTFPSLIDYQKPGHTLTAWNVNGVGLEIINNDAAGQSQILNAKVTGSISYHAVYTEKSNIKVTLNANGGTFADGQKTAEKADQTFGTAVEYETPTREGYTFQGWSTDQDATEGTMSLTCPADDTTYFAVWKPGTVRLTLMANGGTWADSSSYKNGYIDGTVGENVTLPSTADITRDGYDFKGWYVQGDAEQTILSGYKFPATATTLIAKWEPRQESIIFTYGEANQIQAETVIGKHGSAVGYEKGQELISKTYSGYTLTGWTAPDGTVVPAANTGSILIENGKTYTAIWDQNQTSLVFDAGAGASFPNNGQTKTFYGNAGDSLYAGDLIDPFMEGKTFVGWFTEATGSTQVTEFKFPESGSTTYYAHWEDATYTVTFNYNGGKLGEETSSTVTVTHGQSVTSVPTPELASSTLQGWQNLTTGQTMTVDEIEAAKVTADVIYNAVWNGNSYTVRFSNYDGDPNSVATVTVTEGAAPVAPVVKAPDGKVFLHWSDNATQNTYTAEQLTELNVTKDMDFTAVFGEDSYTITFITSNGSFDGGVSQTTVTKQGGQTLAAGDFPTVTGNTVNFTGWYYNGKTQTAEEWGKSNITVSSNMTFVAAFEGKVTVSFNTMGGTWTDAGQQYINGIEGNAGEAMTLPTAQHIERTGWTFAGWYTDMACSTPAPAVFPGSRATYYAKWTTDGLIVTVEENPTYDGTAKTPALEVKSGTTALTENQYVAIYRSNTNVGTATVTVYGIGETYGGLTGTATFTIQKADQTVTFAKSGGQTATYGESFTNTAAAKLDSANATITYSSSDESIAEVDTDGNVTIKKAGTVTITAKSAETSNVNAGTESYTLTISKANPTLRFDNAAMSVKATGTVKNDLTTIPDNLSVTYTSSNTGVATVNATTGAVTLVDEGATTITATFAGDEQYNKAEATYTLTVDNDAISYTAEGWYGTYDGQDHKITVTVAEPNSNYTVTYSTDGQTYSSDPITQTDAGSLTVYYKIETEKYDAVTGSATIIINKAMLTGATVDDSNCTYTGSAVEATIGEVKAGTLTVPTGSYGVTYLNNVNASEAAVAIITANADSNFTDTLVKSFTISPKQLTEHMVSPIPDQPYTGQKIQPAVIVTDSSTSETLTLGKDYTVSYGENNTVGTGSGTVTITGTGNYQDTVTKTFNITNSGTFEVIVNNTTLTYDGKKKEPTVTVWAVSQDGKTKTQLTVGTDYTLTYDDNTNAGKASVTVTGKGAYAASGDSWKTTTAYFTIGKAEQEVSFAGVTDNAVTKTYGDPAFTEAATATLNPDVSEQQAGEITYKTSDATVATVDSATGKVTIVGVGTATITATAAATDNYNGASASYTLTVNPKDIGSEDVTVSKIADQPYEGLPVTPSFTVTDKGANIPKKNLVQNVDYTVEYTDNDKIGTGKITLTGTGNYTGTKEVTFQIVSLQEFTITVAPAPITIYMGGQTGFDQVVVDEDTGAIQASKSLPVPGFLFTLPDALTEALEADGKSATDLIFQERGGTKRWTVVLYNESATNLYRLVAAAGQDPVRVQFTNVEGTTVREDHFEVGQNVNQELTMSIYRGQVGDIVVIYDGVIYPVKTGEDTLTVRGTTSAPQLPTVIAEDDFDLETLEAGKAAVTAPDGTTYAINGGDVQVTDDTGVSLLFDGIIDTDTDNRTEQLKARAEEAYFNDPDDPQPPQEGYQYAYSFQYLDLVDTNNGNAWVKASNDVKVYWPIPEGADETSLKVLHFEGLHRDMATGEIETEISTATVTEVENVTIEGDYVSFEIGSAGFSPFALVWQTKIPYTITATAGSGGSITPSDSVTVLHGDSQTFTITPNGNYRISDVLVDGTSVGAVRTYTFNNVTAGHTIQAVFAYNGGGGSSSGGNGGGGSDHEDEKPSEFPDILDPSDTGVADLLNTRDHIAFLGGYGGGKFGPNDNMTRAQAAQMFYNLLIDQDVPITVNFTDVPADAWYAKAVNTLGSLGIIAGVGNDQFAPERSITRAEFTVIAMRFTNLGLDGENPFSDVAEDAWYYNYVVRAAQYGWIGGYSDGTFRPYNTITRAEVTTIVNRMLGRAADKDYVDAHRGELTQFTDVPTDYWAYYTIMEATNAHDYRIKAGEEDWTGLQ